jgi:dihydrodipicolinate synthase/N-acetylneuraminate lyase
MDMHTRIKVALQHLGVIACSRPRPPLLTVSDDIAARVRATVDNAGLLQYLSSPRRVAS